MGNTKLGFMNIPNGDVIAFDMKESEINPSVVYLSHDDGEGHGYILPSLTVEKQKNGCKASKINACSRFLFRNDMCYCAIFFTLW